MEISEKLDHIRKYCRSDNALKAMLKLEHKELDMIKGENFTLAIEEKINATYKRLTQFRK